MKVPKEEPRSEPKVPPFPRQQADRTLCRRFPWLHSRQRTWWPKHRIRKVTSKLQRMSTKRRQVYQRITGSLPAIVSPLSCTISPNFPDSSSSTGEGASCFRWPAPLASAGSLSPRLNS